MREFKIGDRVRVRDLPATGFHAGRVGEVVWVICSPASGAVVSYNVRLDGQSLSLVVPFRPDELEPESQGKP